MKNIHLRAKIDSAILNLASSFDLKDVKLLTAYAACLLLYKNSQRSGVVENLTLKEFSQRQRKLHNNEERIVIPCLNHKTGPKGTAQLVTTAEGEELLIQYHILVRAKITPNQGVTNCSFLLAEVPSILMFTGKYAKALKLIVLMSRSHQS